LGSAVIDFVLEYVFCVFPKVYDSIPTPKIGTKPGGRKYGGTGIFFE